ncbi:MULTISPECIES: DUF58 domain-containing protein [Paenibacillus]|nr:MULTISPECIES: DUF58 domain-containing protein [Paenibacillus]
MMPLHWLILFLGIALALLGIVYKKWALKNVYYTRTFTKQKLFVGESVEMIETIGNDKLLPLPWVRLESMIHSSLRFESQSNLDVDVGEISQNHKSLFALMPYTQIVRRHHITCMGRGVYQLDSATMTVGDPFGIIDKVRRIPLSLEIVVFPQLVPIEHIPFSNKSWIGDITVRRWILEDPFWKSGVRPYCAGDSLKSVHWKATARTNQLQVHKFDYTADRKLMIIVNFETSERMWSKVTRPEGVEQALSYAASIANLTVMKGIETGFSCNGSLHDRPKGQAVTLTPAAGSHHLSAMFDLMSKLELELTLSFESLMKQWEDAANTDFVIITPIRLSDGNAVLSRIRMRGNGVELVVLPEPSLRVTEAKEVNPNAG